MSFSRQINQHAEKYERRMRQVFGASVEQLAELANTPTARGGRMRVDTGFLRSSLQAQRGSMPEGASTPASGAQYNWSVSSVTAELLRWRPDDSLFLGWTANYAIFREYKDGFRRSAAQKWNSIVKANAKRFS